jgi:HlyD family type I secretion membrane fusion protein
MERKSRLRKASASYMGPVLFSLAVIFLTFGVAGGWAAIAPLASAVVAPGVISVENNRKSVQHLEGGIVSEINVQEGQKVNEGDVLFRLDKTQALASDLLVKHQLNDNRIIEARLLAERDGLEKIEFPSDLLKASEQTETIARTIRDQISQFNEAKASIDGQIDILKSRIDQAQTRIDGLKQQLASTREQIEFVNKELVGVRELYKRQLTSADRLFALERERARLEGQIGSTTADISGTEATIGEAQLQIHQIRQGRMEDAAKQITEVRKNVNEAQERLTVSNDLLRRTAIVAPRSGRIFNLKVFTIGQVIRPGDTLAEIVPDNEGLIINVQISPLDIENVHPGMEAQVRFSSFKSRNMPAILGELREVSADRLVDETTRQPYFSGQVVVSEDKLPSEIHGRLTPGMPADIIVPTGERTVMEYLVHPLKTSLIGAFTEE